MITIRDAGSQRSLPEGQKADFGMYVVWDRNCSCQYCS